MLWWPGSTLKDRILFHGVIAPAPVTATSQNIVQNSLMNAPDFVKESPERILIAISLVAAAVIGYYLSQRTKSQE